MLSNAIKFTPKGGVVRLDAERSGSRAIIRVSDTGQGIRPEFLPHLFEPFRQGEGGTSRRQGGLGLGLTIVKQLLDAHRGRIEASSEGEGRGTTFTIELPAELPPPMGLRDASVRAVAGAAGSMAGMSVLVVDDEPDARELVARLLEEQRAGVATADSAERGLALLEELRPDVIISDIGMPGTDGYELIGRVRELPAARGGMTPAIALTAYARPQDAERALAAGFQAHVAKPVDSLQLTSLVARLAKAGVMPPARAAAK